VQVHDEVILEGPKVSALKAKELVVQCMAHPWAWAAHHQVCFFFVDIGCQTMSDLFETAKGVK